MSIKSERLSSFSFGPGDQAFKWSLAKTILPTLIFTILTLIGLNELLELHPFTDVPLFPKLIFTGGFAICAWVAWAQTTAGLGENALVAVLKDRELWVRLRSPLNKNVGTPEDNLLVGLPLDKLKWSQVYNLKTITRMNNKPKTRDEQFLDLGFEDLDFHNLIQLQQAERTIRKAAGHSHVHYPIRLLDDHTVRLSLYNVSGGANRLQRSLPSSVAVKDVRAEVLDLRKT
jgi:hypothetical protein